MATTPIDGGCRHQRPEGSGSRRAGPAAGPAAMPMPTRWKCWRAPPPRAAMSARCRSWWPRPPIRQQPAKLRLAMLNGADHRALPASMPAAPRHGVGRPRRRHGRYRSPGRAPAVKPLALPAEPVALDVAGQGKRRYGRRRQGGAGRSDLARQAGAARAQEHAHAGRRSACSRRGRAFTPPTAPAAIRTMARARRVSPPRWPAPRSSPAGPTCRCACC